MFGFVDLLIKKMRNLSHIESLLDVFGDGFSSFRNGVSGKFSGEDELDSRLDLTGRKSSSLVESDELWSLSGDSVEGVVDEGVHDVHGLLWDSDVGVHLLEDLVDVNGEGLNSSSSGFLVGSGFFGLGRFLSHFDLQLIRITQSAFLIDLKYNKSDIIIFKFWLAQNKQTKITVQYLPYEFEWEKMAHFFST